MLIDTTHPNKLISRSEAAKFLGLAVGTLEVWACTKRYDLPYIKIGRSVKYRVSDLLAFVQSRIVGMN